MNNSAQNLTDSGQNLAIMARFWPKWPDSGTGPAPASASLPRPAPARRPALAGASQQKAENHADFQLFAAFQQRATQHTCCCNSMSVAAAVLLGWDQPQPAPLASAGAPAQLHASSATSVEHRSLVPGFQERNWKVTLFGSCASSFLIKFKFGKKLDAQLPKVAPHKMTQFGRPASSEIKKSHFLLKLDAQLPNLALVSTLQMLLNGFWLFFYVP